jgi:hypothetical protein
MTKVKFVPNRKTITRLDPKRDAGRRPTRTGAQIA